MHASLTFAMSAVLACSVLSGIARAEDLQKIIPTTSACNDAAETWRDKMGLIHSFATEVKVQGKAGDYHFVLATPLMGRSLKALPAVPVDAEPQMHAATKAWMVVLLYNENMRVDPDFSDYQVQAFFEEGAGDTGSCFAVYPDGVDGNDATVVPHDSLSAVVGDIRDN